jgi:hypothetical protein
MKLINRIRMRGEKYMGKELIVKVRRWVKGKRRVWLNNNGKVLKVLIMRLPWNFKHNKLKNLSKSLWIFYSICNILLIHFKLGIFFRIGVKELCLQISRRSDHGPKSNFTQGMNWGQHNNPTMCYELQEVIFALFSLFRVHIWAKRGLVR